VGLLLTAGVAIVLAAGFNLDSIASLGSAIALLVFVLITVGHLRVRTETGARVSLLLLAIVTAGGVFVTFVFTTLVHEPGTALAMAGILVLSIALDYAWKRRRGLRPSPAPA
jgi:hypothetical protein